MRSFQPIVCLLSGIILTGCFSGAPWSTPSDHAIVPSSAFQQEIADAQEPAAPGNEEKRAEVLLADSLTQGIEADVMLEDVEPLDAETLADNQLLQGEDQLPPEDPGQVLAHEEPIYDFPVVENDKVRYFVDYYSGRAKNTFRIWLERSGRYLPMMSAIFAEAGLPKDLAYLAMVESGFNDKAYSWALGSLSKGPGVIMVCRMIGGTMSVVTRRKQRVPLPVFSRIFIPLLMVTGTWRWLPTMLVPASFVRL
jgi:membrane-bound lytic murein transglycosylase D